MAADASPSIPKMAGAEKAKSLKRFLKAFPTKRQRTVKQCGRALPPASAAAKAAGHKLRALGNGRPRVGLELTSRLQLSTQPREVGRGLRACDCNNVCLLRLSAALPVVSPKSGEPATTCLSFGIASLSACTAAGEGIGNDLGTCSNLGAGNVSFVLSVCCLFLTTRGDHSLRGLQEVGA